MPSHSVFPDPKVFGKFVLFKKVDFLQSVVSFLINAPLFSSHKFCFLIMVKRNPLTTDGHILGRIALSIGDDLIVVRVIDTVEIEEVFYHFWEVII
jgi:hypothetical protein